MSDSFRYNSTYASSENKVTGHVELEGLEAISLVDKNKEHNKGIIEAAANNNDKSAIHFYAHGAYNIIYNDNGNTTSDNVLQQEEV